MQRSSDRGYVEPFAALAAVLALSAGLVLYADAVGIALEETGAGDRETAQITLDRVHDHLRAIGVVDPSGLRGTGQFAPDGWQMNVTLRTENTILSRGPSPAHAGEPLSASRPVSVRINPGTIKPGQLDVVIWQ